MFQRNKIIQPFTVKKELLIKYTLPKTTGPSLLCHTPTVQTPPVKSQNMPDTLQQSTLSFSLSTRISPKPSFVFFSFSVLHRVQIRAKEIKSHKALKPLLALLFNLYYSLSETKQRREFMEVSSGFVVVLLICYLLTLLFQFSNSATVVVDGVSEWKNPSVHIGDSIIFKPKYHYNLYIFQNREAFNLCNFTQATILTKSNSTSFTWHPSRPGFFYFSFNNGSLKACHEGQKLAIEVSSSPPPENTAPSPELSPASAPRPISGGIISSSPAYSLPFQPHEPKSPSPAPTAILPATSPSSIVPPDKGSGVPFINSNPAVPLPTGEVDSATIRPLPSSGHRGQVVGLYAVQMVVCCVCFLVLW